MQVVQNRTVSYRYVYFVSCLILKFDIILVCYLKYNFESFLSTWPFEFYVFRRI